MKPLQYVLARTSMRRGLVFVLLTWLVLGVSTFTFGATKAYASGGYTY